MRDNPDYFIIFQINKVTYIKRVYTMPNGKQINKQLLKQNVWVTHIRISSMKWPIILPVTCGQNRTFGIIAII